jgi:hypothetical protein
MNAFTNVKVGQGVPSSSAVIMSPRLAKSLLPPLDDDSTGFCGREKVSLFRPPLASQRPLCCAYRVRYRIDVELRLDGGAHVLDRGALLRGIVGLFVCCQIVTSSLTPQTLHDRTLGTLGEDFSCPIASPRSMTSRVVSDCERTLIEVENGTEVRSHARDE